MSPRFCIYFPVLLLGGLAVQAADPQQLAVVVRAQSDFDRVERAAGPDLPDATRCEQSQAALLPVALPAELAAVHFRKGYCTLSEALITHRPEDYQEAAGEFDKAIQAWPEHAAVSSRKSGVAPPVPSGMRVLASVARLKAAADPAGMTRAERELSAAVDPAVCMGGLLPANDCQAVIETGKVWLGWMDLQRDDLFQAGARFATLPDSGWHRWAAGESAFHYRNYAEAAGDYGKAVDWWKRTSANPPDSLAERLLPQPDMAKALRDWGGAQLLSGDQSAAIVTLDAAVKASPNPARALYLRARAEELAGRKEAAYADLSLASRTAFADAKDLASGEAHLYRGILLYRRQQYSQAESEFASALNFDIPKALRPDAVAWRHLASVAGGACSASRRFLEESLAAVSPYFPKDEAREVASRCPLS